MTKPLPEDALKCHLEVNLDDAKITVVPQLVDNTLPLCPPPHVVPLAAVQPKKPKTAMVKTKMTTKTLLEEATSQLYNLESTSRPEKCLNLDLDLYQMEDY